MKRDPSTPTASVHYLPNFHQAPYPRRGNGRLPKSIASIRVARRARLVAQREPDSSAAASVERLGDALSFVLGLSPANFERLVRIRGLLDDARHDAAPRTPA